MPSIRAPQRATAKKEQIASAARTLFLAQGFAGTSMDAVTAAAGVSKQTLYTYFPSKVDLLAEVITEEVSAQDLPGPSGQPPATREEFRQAVLAFAHGMTSGLMRPDSLALLRLVIGEGIRIPELRDLIREALPAQLLHLAEAMVRRAAAAGLVTAPRPDISARMLVGPLMSFIALDGLLRVEPSPAPPDRDSLTLVVDAFLATVPPPLAGSGEAS